MNNRIFFTVTAFFLLLSLSPLSVASGQEPGMEPQLPGNPMTRMMSGLNPANWSMPKLKMPTMDRFLPTKQEKDRVITKKNGLVDEVSSTTKKTWQRTKETLNPMRLIPAGFRQNGATQPAPKTDAQPGFFSRLFSPFPARDADPPAQTVTDFLKQEPIR